MEPRPFLKPELKGARFNEHAIPLEFLRDLAVLSDMVVEVAKSKFLEERRDRQRSPRGFTDGISLALSGVGEGSAIPSIVLLVGMSNRLFHPYLSYYEEARDAIIAAISAASDGGSPTDHLTEKSLVYFDRFGRNLRDGEVIEFPTDDPGSPARLTKVVRRKLLLASPKVEELTEEVELRGKILKLNQGTKIFHLKLADGREIPAPITDDHYDNIIDALKGFKQGFKLLVQGVGKSNRQGRLQRIDSIEHTTILDLQDIPARFEELKILKDDWLDGRSRAPSPAGLDWLSALFAEGYPDSLPLPFAYPIAEGGVQLEWPIQPNEVSLEIDLDLKTGEWHVLNFDTDKEEARSLNLQDSTSWTWMIDQIREMAGVPQSDG